MDYFRQWNAKMTLAARRHKMKTSEKTADDIIAHFQKRCIQRIGIILGQRTLRELRDTGKLFRLEKQSNTKTVFLLKREDWNGKQMLQFDVVIIYDKARHAFVTTWKYDENWRPWHEAK